MVAHAAADVPALSVSCSTPRLSSRTSPSLVVVAVAAPVQPLAAGWSMTACCTMAPEMMAAGCRTAPGAVTARSRPAAGCTCRGSSAPMVPLQAGDRLAGERATSCSRVRDSCRSRSVAVALPWVASMAADRPAVPRSSGTVSPAAVLAASSRVVWAAARGSGRRWASVLAGRVSGVRHRHRGPDACAASDPNDAGANSNRRRSRLGRHRPRSLAGSSRTGRFRGRRAARCRRRRWAPGPGCRPAPRRRSAARRARSPSMCGRSSFP